MKITRFKPFRFTRMEEHAAWLAEMARQGWHYQGQAFTGTQNFEQGAPAEVTFCWDQAPRDERDAPVYRQKCREAGWELAGTAGHWHCWRQAVQDGQPAPALRDAADTKTMFEKLYRYQVGLVCLHVAVICLHLPNVVRNPAWFRGAIVAAIVVAAIYQGQDALRARARLRAAVSAAN